MRQWQKIKAVALFEFQCTVRSKSWLIATFGMPFFLLLYAAVVSIPVLLEKSKEEQVTVYGVVDQQGVLGLKDDVAMPGPEIPEEIRSAIHAAGQQEILKQKMLWVQNIVFRPLISKEAAHAALKEGRIRGYYLIPEDYAERGIIESYSPEISDITGSESRQALGNLLAEGLLRGKVTEAVSARVRKPIAETRAWIVTPEGEIKKGGGPGRAVRLLVPFAFAILLLMSIMMSAGGLVQATAIEKENKVVEVILSSAKADEILMGKLLGMGAAGMIQVAAWFGMLAITGLAAAGELTAMGVEIPWAGIVSIAIFFPLAYLFFGSLMLGTGSLGSNQKEANQWGMIWSLLAVVPLLFLNGLLHEPHGIIGRVLIWIPFTAPITMVVRLTLDPGGIAWWEVAGAVAVLVTGTWLAIRIGAGLFRVGILLTGARPKLRAILRQARLS